MQSNASLEATIYDIKMTRIKVFTCNNIRRRVFCKLCLNQHARGTLTADLETSQLAKSPSVVRPGTFQLPALSSQEQTNQPCWRFSEHCPAVTWSSPGYISQEARCTPFGFSSK